jgi:hypothetical protein
MLSFFTHGDSNWRHNVSGYPLLNPLVGILFIAGFVVTLKGTWKVFRNIFQGKETHLEMIYPYLLLVFIGMMAPVITTAEGMPHALRSLGMLIPVYVMAGLAGAIAVRKLVRWTKRDSSEGIAYGLIGGLFIVCALYDASLYFIISRNSPEAYISYRGDLTEISKHINEYVKNNPKNPKPYVVIDPYFAQTIHFLASSGAHDYLDLSADALHKYRVIDPAKEDVVFVKKGEQVIFTQSTISDADRYEERFGEAIKKVDSKLNRFGDEVMRVYEGVDSETPYESFDLDA